MKKNSSEYQTKNRDNLTKVLKILHLKYSKNSITAQINVNSERNKFQLLVSQIDSSIVVLMIPETIIEEFFQFCSF